MKSEALVILLIRTLIPATITALMLCLIVRDSVVKLEVLIALATLTVGLVAVVFNITRIMHFLRSPTPPRK